MNVEGKIIIFHNKFTALKSLTVVMTEHKRNLFLCVFLNMLCIKFTLRIGFLYKYLYNPVTLNLIHLNIKSHFIKTKTQSRNHSLSQFQIPNIFKSEKKKKKKHPKHKYFSPKSRKYIPLQTRNPLITIFPAFGAISSQILANPATLFPEKRTGSLYGAGGPFLSISKGGMEPNARACLASALLALNQDYRNHHVLAFRYRGSRGKDS